MMLNPQAPEILLLGMFDVTRPDRARAVRIHNLYLTLQTLTPIRLLGGDRSARRKAVLQYLARGGLRRTRAVYVEASTSTATESDLLLLWLAHSSGIPIIVFIPDAYQYFPALYPRVGLKTTLLDWGWRRSIATYVYLADILLFPSQGLAACFQPRRQAGTLPPAGPAAQEQASLTNDPPTIVYVGAATHEYGSDLLLDAMHQVVSQWPRACCRLITGDTTYLDQHPLRHAPWLTVERRAFDELPAIMHSATLAVIPRPINAYNNLAMPIKLFDYMAFGLPLVVTACRDTANLVQRLESGLVVEDNAAALANGIIRLLADRKLAQRLGNNGYQAIQTTHSWSHRARELLEMVEELEAARVPNRQPK